MIKNIKAVTIDLWNTIIETSFYTNDRVNFFTSYLNNLGHNFSKEKIKEAYLKINYFDENYSKNNDYKHVYNTWRLEEVLKLLKIEHKKEMIHDILKHWENIILERPPKLKSNVKKVIKQLSKKYHLALISDTGLTPGNVLEKMLKNYQIHQYFEHFTFSDETGYFKPDHHNFTITLDKLNINPNEAIHIGDMLDTDVLGSKSVGMKSIWVRSKEFYREGAEKEIVPDFIIDDFIELHDILLA